MDLTVQPLVPRLWPAFEALMQETGPAARCWCMYWQVGGQYRRRSASENRESFRHIVQGGPPPGLLALDGDAALGWCQITPKAVVPTLERTWRLRSVDDVPAWAITCILVRKAHRRRGVTAALVAGAVQHAREAGAPAVEAYPFDASVSPSATGTGFASTFERAGFVTIARRAPARPIMRLDLGQNAGHGIAGP
jgi:GNAT superfamily N-acetyltransferase